MIRVVNKLLAVKQRLKVWNKAEFGNINSNIEDVKQLIKLNQLELEKGSFSAMDKELLLREN
jgi:hypothetical protein